MDSNPQYDTPSFSLVLSIWHVSQNMNGYESGNTFCLCIRKGPGTMWYQALDKGGY